MARTTPDNDINGFLSHQVEPVEEVIRVRIEVQLEIPDRIASIR